MRRASEAGPMSHWCLQSLIQSWVGTYEVFVVESKLGTAKFVQDGDCQRRVLSLGLAIM